MSFFEVPPMPQPDGDPNHSVPLPDVVDEQWCADFNGEHGYRGRRAIVNTYVALRQAMPLYRCAGPPRDRRFYEEDFGDVPEEGLFFDGEIVNVRLVPIWDDYSEEYEHIPHLAMRDVIDAEDGSPIAPPHEEVWVPLTENGDEIVMY